MTSLICSLYAGSASTLWRFNIFQPVTRCYLAICCSLISIYSYKLRRIQLKAWGGAESPPLTITGRKYPPLRNWMETNLAPPWSILRPLEILGAPLTFSVTLHATKPKYMPLTPRHLCVHHDCTPPIISLPLRYLTKRRLQCWRSKSTAKL